MRQKFLRPESKKKKKHLDFSIFFHRFPLLVIHSAARFVDRLEFSLLVIVFVHAAPFVDRAEWVPFRHQAPHFVDRTKKISFVCVFELVVIIESDRIRTETFVVLLRWDRPTSHDVQQEERRNQQLYRGHFAEIRKILHPKIILRLLPPGDFRNYLS